MKKVLPILLVVLIVLSAGWYFYKYNTERSPNELQFYGNVENRTQTLAFRFLGTLDALFKDEGESIQKGEKLAVLDTTPLAYQLQNLTQQYNAQKEILHKLQNGYQPEQIAQAKAQYEESKAALLGIQDTYIRKRKLIKTKTITDQDFLLAKAAYEQAVAAVDRAKSSYNLFQNGYRKEDIAAQENSVASLQTQMQSLQYDINQSSLYAPANATILKRFVEPGSIITPAQSIFEIALQKSYWVRAYIDEPQLGKIKKGQRMLVYTDVKDTPYEGHIGFISDVAEFTPKNVETEALRTDLVYRFRVIIDNHDTMLKQGMPVTIKLSNGN